MQYIKLDIYFGTGGVSNVTGTRYTEGWSIINQFLEKCQGVAYILHKNCIPAWPLGPRPFSEAPGSTSQTS